MTTFEQAGFYSSSVLGVGSFGGNGRAPVIPAW